MRLVSCWLLALGLTAAAMPGGRAETPAGPRDLVGQPVLALAAHPDVTLTLRQSTGGRQSAVARQARNPGPGLRVTPDGQFIYGWGCDARTGCEANGFFLAYDLTRPQIFLILYEKGSPLSWVPPRASPWPAALAAPIRDFSPKIADYMNFARP